MNPRRVLQFQRALLIAVLAFVVFSVVPAVPTQSLSEAEACNPCDCPEDDRMNCQGIEHYGFYYRFDKTGACYYEAYLIVPGREQGRFAFRLTPDEIAKIPATVQTNTLLKSKLGIELYKLTSGELQVNAGPNAEGKVYVMKFQGCPAYNIVESSFIAGE